MMPSIFDPSYATASQAAVTKAFYDNVNAQNLATFEANAAGWLAACADKGVVLPNKPVPPAKWHVDAAGVPTQGPDLVAGPVADPVFNNTVDPMAGRIAAIPTGLSYEQHLLLIEAMLREIYSKLAVP